MASRPQPGFTLVELIFVIALLSLGFTGITNLYANLQSGLLRAEAMQKATQIAQSCAERMMVLRRLNAYGDASVTNACSTAPAVAETGYNTPGVTSAAATSTDGCPSGGTCSKVTITVSCAGTTAACPSGVSSSLAMLLVSY
ncbi:prepilin-type N-terminal cleavage/methylation domain-containing protein [Noviherbaspirillum humi]|uniref:Prepilin-type N-terminal cleavage/methylation domain-containing protein n=1 Tax=Noviherbaspirillum humi TaxID=1688639 RepID=A0A239HNC3_9BURK|nr:type II secretion system protein [Noviherbaspirillum humi]SNS82625.1 prepilin-type N-terminal cleavage/methylation domain-containing protein [Noviherbaspirillum humi]